MEDAQDSKTLKKDMDKAPDIETEIKRAMCARVGHFKEQADSLTLEGVRRLLEKDLGLKTNALDVHKRFIKQCLQECFDAAADENVSKNSGEDVEKYDCSGREETEKLPEGLQSEKEVKEPISEDEEKMEGSPVLGLLAGHKMTQHDTEETQGIENQEVPSEDTLKKAIKKRSSYFRANSEKLTLVGARRLLEEDLKLDKNSLDAHKKFITEQLDEVLKSPEVAKSANGVIKKRVKKTVHRKPPSKVSSEGSSDSLDSEDEKVDEDEVKPPKKISSKGNAQNSEGLKKRKRSAKETKNSSNKGNKAVEPMSEGSTDAEEGGDGSEDGHSQSSAEKLVKKKEVSTQAYGKHVEHLKSIIKSCAMSVPPTVYKRVKQAPESKRESYLIKELEAILGKEGLSTNPSEKEIKEVRKKKERAKELEGIDMSNIVSSSRRRSTSNFVIPPKPKIQVESEGDDEEDTDDADDDDDDDDDSNSEGTSREFREGEYIVLDKVPFVVHLRDSCKKGLFVDHELQLINGGIIPSLYEEGTESLGTHKAPLTTIEL